MGESRTGDFGTKVLRNLNGVDLAYVNKGTGEPIIFLHGGFSDLRSWDSQVRTLSTDYRCIAYSLRYHYPNPWTGDGSDYTVSVHQKDLAKLIERLEAHPAHLIGTSYGGRVALHFARDRPELVRTLVLAEPALGFWLRDTLEGTTLLNGLMKNYFGPGETAIKMGNLEGAVRLFVDGVGGAGTFDRLPGEVRRRYEDNIRVQAFPSSPEPFTRDDAKRIRTPVLLVEGESTNQMFASVDEELVRQLPDVEREIIPGASHLMTVFHPNEFNEKALAFLAKHRRQ